MSDSQMLNAINAVNAASGSWQTADSADVYSIRGYWRWGKREGKPKKDLVGKYQKGLQQFWSVSKRCSGTELLVNDDFGGH